MSNTEYCRLCDSPIASAYDSYCKAHDAEDEIMQLGRQLKASEAECEELKQMQAHLKWKDETRKECERLKKALGESINYRECNLNYTQALDALCKAELFYSN